MTKLASTAVAQLKLQTDPYNSSHKNFLNIEGGIFFDNVQAIFQQGLKLMAPYKSITVDLRALKQCDSSGLALCSAWAQHCHTKGKQIEFSQVPEFMQNIMKVYGVDTFLPILSTVPILSTPT